MAAANPNTRRAWDDFYFFQPISPGERMYDRLLVWVRTMLQDELTNDRLQKQQVRGDEIFNQFAVGQIGAQQVRTVPERSPQIHCEEQLIKMIRQQQDEFIIYTENFTCQMREGTEKRCNCFFQVCPNYMAFRPNDQISL